MKRAGENRTCHWATIGKAGMHAALMNGRFSPLQQPVYLFSPVPGQKSKKSTPTACPRFFAFLPPHSTPPSMFHGSLRNKLNQPTNSAHPDHGTCPARSNSVRTGKILACLVLCRTTEWLLPSSTVSREPTILVELSFMIPDLFPCNRHKNQGHTQVHSNRAEPHDLFLRQKLAILIMFELYFDK